MRGGAGFGEPVPFSRALGMARSLESGHALEVIIGACSCRRTGAHPGSSPWQAFAGTCANIEGHGFWKVGTRRRVSAASNTPIHSARIWVVSASSFALKTASVRMSRSLLRPASDREPRPTGKLLDARSSGTARKTLLADALCLPGEFRKNTSGRSRKCPSRNLSGKLPQRPSFAPTRIERCSAPSFP
jgi:hypothetical protein